MRDEKREYKSGVNDIVLGADLETGWTCAAHSSLVWHLKVVFFLHLLLLLASFEFHFRRWCLCSLRSRQVLQGFHVIQAGRLLLAELILLIIAEVVHVYAAGH